MADANLAGDIPPKSIDLNPEDWRWVTYRERTPLPRPEPRPFDKEECLARLEEAKRARRWGWNWPEAKISLPLSAEEAHFWFTAMTGITEDQWKSVDSAFAGRTPRSRKIAELEAARDQLRKDLIAELAKQSFSGQVTLDEVRTRIAGLGRVALPYRLIPLLSNLLSLEDLVDLIQHGSQIHTSSLWHGRLLRDYLGAFRTHVLPYLTQEEITRLHPRLRPNLDPAQWPAQYRDTLSAAFHLATSLGMHEEMLALVRSWPDDFYSGEDWRDHYHRPQEIVFGLGSAELVEAEMRRLELRLKNPTYIRAWLAHTQYAALDVVRDSILAQTNKKEAKSLLETFAIVHAPEAAPHVLALRSSSKAPQVARQWLEDNPEHAVAGLIPVAAERGKLADAARKFLTRMKHKGYEPLISAHLEQAPAEVADCVRAEVFKTEVMDYIPFDDQTTPAWLREAPPVEKKKRRTKKPTWADPAVLPPVVVGKHALNEAQVASLLQALQQSKLDQPAHPLVASLQAHADRDALEAFAWELFEMWLQEGAPSKDKWALSAVGLFGGDGSALKLAPLVRVWPGESQHSRAVLGLQCLRAIGTDTALMQINGIAQKVRYKALKARAREAMEAIAKERNLTRQQLEDLIVPDCGLDERGSRVFDFGPRQFRFALGPEMKPMVRDDKGKLRANPPKPGVKDDAELAAQAVADWKLLKKQVRQVAKIQAVRLEQAMVTGRRWPLGEFETLLVRHPLMVNLARLLLWGGYDASGELAATFRVTEDQTYADAEDEGLALAGIERVGIVHPLHLADELKSAWGELLSDYEIVPPFAQLGREVYHLEDEELEAKEITRFAHVKVPAISLVGTLEQLGWARGVPEDAGWFYEHSKPFYEANVTAIVRYEGAPVRYLAEGEDQGIERCFFVPGIYTPVIYPRHENILTLGKVDPVAISEVLRDLSTIAAKGK